MKLRLETPVEMVTGTDEEAPMEETHSRLAYFPPCPSRFFFFCFLLILKVLCING